MLCLDPCRLSMDSYFPHSYMKYRGNRLLEVAFWLTLLINNHLCAIIVEYTSLSLTATVTSDHCYLPKIQHFGYSSATGSHLCVFDVDNANFNTCLVSAGESDVGFQPS